jgi:hypothetical protein
MKWVALDDGVDGEACADRAGIQVNTETVAKNPARQRHRTAFNLVYCLLGTVIIEYHSSCALLALWDVGSVICISA